MIDLTSLTPRSAVKPKSGVLFFIVSFLIISGLILFNEFLSDKPVLAIKENDDIIEGESI